MSEITMNIHELKILIEQAVHELENSEFDACELHLNQALSQTSADSEIYIQALFYKACLRKKQRLMEDSVLLFNELIAVSSECSDKATVAIFLSKTGYELTSLSDYTGAKKAYQHSLDLFTTIGNEEQKSEVLALLAITYYYSSDIHTAIKLTLDAMKITEAMNNLIQKANNLNALGNFYLSLSDYKQALLYFEESLLIAEKIDNQRIVAACYGNISNIYHHLENYELAIEYTEKLLLKSSFIDDKHVAGAYINIAQAYRYIGQADKALDYCTRALLLNQRLGSKADIAKSYGILGVIFCSQNKYTEAIESFQNALYLNTEIVIPSSQARNLANLGFVYAQPDFEKYDYQTAYNYLNQALELEQQYGNKEGLVHIYDSLSELHERVGKWQQALEYYKLKSDCKAELLNEANMKAADSFHKALEKAEQEKIQAIQQARYEATEQLLHNVLPPVVAEKMLVGKTRIAESFPEVSIFFSDIVGFTKLSQKVTAEELVDILNLVFTEFDRLAAKHSLEKVKTIGDAYMAVCGAPIPNEHHAKNISLFALDACAIVQNLQPIHGEKLQIRIGLHCGHVVGGVIGEKKFAYDLWGDTVNTASRMESHGEAGKIHISEDFKNSLVDYDEFTFIPREPMFIKGKGLMNTYFLQ